jgi:tetratricopeptide (TPR) repeat protein
VNLGASFVRMGTFFSSTGKPDKALEHYKLGIDLLETVLQHKQDSEVKLTLRSAYWGRATIMGRLGRHAEAVQAWDRAVELDTWPTQDFFRRKRAISLAAAGDHARALAEIDELSKREMSASGFYDLASAYSQISAAIYQDDKLAPAERQKAAEEVAARAVHFLVKADTNGYFDASWKLDEMKKNPEFTPIRSRTDFKKLLADIEQKAKTPDK